MAEHKHFCGTQSEWSHREGLGCTCGEPGCNAVYHVLGWQDITVLPAPEEKNPCAVILEEPEFDVEEYRMDLNRRYNDLTAMANSARDRYNNASNPFSESAHAERDDMNRYANKAAGIRIALDLLPRRTQ